MPSPLQAESWRLYSWWWDSHVSPKNSKWLQEDLTDMDIRVKHMLKLLEEDGDSFAMRAEMYYKRRPELIELVEEFYRAYRALAERYAHATRGLQQAHHAMTKALHNDPCASLDSPLTSPSTESEPPSPHILLQTHNLFDPHDILKEPSGLPCHFPTIRTNGIYSEEFDPPRSKKGLKQVNELFALSVGGKLSSGSLSERIKQIIQEAKISDLEPYDTPEVSRVEDNKETVKVPLPVYQEHMLQLKEKNDHLHEMVAHTQKEGVRSLKEREIKIKMLEESLALTKENLDRKRDEIDELCIAVEEEHLRSMQAETKLLILEELHFQCESDMNILLLDAEKRSHLWEDAKQRKHDLEQTVGVLELLIKNLQDEKLLQEELQSKLEGEIREITVGKEALQLENIRLQEQVNDVELKQLSVLNRIDVLSVELQTLQGEVKRLHDENLSLKDRCESCEGEKVLLSEKLANMEPVLEKNYELLNCLKDAEFQIDELKREMKILEDWISTLHKLNSSLEAENRMLRKNVRAIQGDKRELMNRNVFLENSSSDANLRLEETEEKVRGLEDTCQSLSEENFLLENEQHALILQVESVSKVIKSWEKCYMELCGKLSCLEAEKDSTAHRVSELEYLIILAKQENETVLSSNARMAVLEDVIHRLGEEVQSTQAELLNKEFEALIFQNCLSDQRDKNVLIEQEKSKEEFSEKQRKIDDLSACVGNLKEEVTYIQRGSGLDESDRDSLMEDKYFRLVVEKSIGETFLQQFAQNMLDLTATTDNRLKDALVVEEENRNLREELDKLWMHNMEARAKEEKLISRLVEEFEILTEDSHLAVVCSMLFEEKMQEMMRIYKDYELRDEGNTGIHVKMEPGTACNKERRGKCDIREEEDKESNAELYRCHKLVLSISDIVSHLEDCIHISRKHRETKEETDVKIEIRHPRSPPEVAEELQKVLDKLDIIQRSVTLTEGHGTATAFTSEAGTESTGHPKMSNSEKEICMICTKDHKPRRDGTKNSDDRDEIILKDIQLDSISSISREGSYISLREFDQSSHDKISGTCQTGKRKHDLEKQDSYPSVTDDYMKQHAIRAGEQTEEKELGVKRVQVGDWIDVMHRLSVDAQRLASLRTSAVDAKRRLESIEGGNYLMATGCHTVKKQLKLVEDSIKQLTSMNGKLTKRANNGSSSLSSSQDTEELDDVCNQQKRGSRKIGRWELELQKVQSSLHEFEENIERQRSRSESRGSKSVLSDFLFRRGERRTTQQLCGCVETKDNCHVRRSLLKPRSFSVD